MVREYRRRCNIHKVEKLKTFTKLSVRETVLSLSERLRKEPHVRSPKEVIILIFIFL